MATLGHNLVFLVEQHSSGVSEAIIAESTSVSVDISAEALEITSQTSALNAEFIGGKVSGTISGDYLLATDAAQFNLLFAKVNAGEKLDCIIELSDTAILDGQVVLTSLNLGGGLSDALATGSYAGTFSGDMAP